MVETQKGAIEIEIFEDGVIERCLVQPGTKVPVGTAAGADRAGEAAKPRASGRWPRPTADAGAAGGAGTCAAPLSNRTVPAQPRAGHRPPRAGWRAERGIDLARPRAAAGRAARSSMPMSSAPQPGRRPSGPPSRLDLGEMRRAIAAAMARSKREIPHYYLSTTIDLTRALAPGSRLPTQPVRPAQRLLLAALLLKAVARALGQAPSSTASLPPKAFQPGAGIHIGTAIAHARRRPHRAGHPRRGQACASTS